MDGLSLAAVCHELNALVGGRIDKIQQPEKDELLLGIYSNGVNYRLTVSASPDNCRVLLTDERRASPTEAPVFLMLMRKYMTGAHILSVSQPSMDRLIEFEVETYSELYDVIHLRLICEIMGRHSNIILVDGDGCVVDAIRHVSPSVSSARLVLPHVKYEYPPSKVKLDPCKASAADFFGVISGALKPESALADTYYGLSPAVAKRLVSSFGCAANDAIAVSLERFYQEFQRGIFSPCIVKADDGSFVCTLPFCPSVDEKCIEYATMSQAVEAFYALRAAAESVKRRTSSYERIIKNAIQKLERKLAIYSDAISSGDEIARLQLWGELITANLHSLSKKTSSAVVVDYYREPAEAIEIPLDPLLYPAENAQRFFAKSRKLKQARTMAMAMQKEVNDELSYLDELLYTLSCCEGEPELNDLRCELISGGYLREGVKCGSEGKASPKGKANISAKKKTGGGSKQPVSKPYSFLSKDGIPILVGKNNQQNDRLTLKTALPDETWLHTKSVHGSHVIIRKSGEIPETTLFDAAVLAAHYSQARGSDNVPVDYTQVRYVKKPSGARPGMVIYTHQHTVYVTPDGEYVAKLAK